MDSATITTSAAAIILISLTLLPRLIKFKKAELKAKNKFAKTSGTELNVPVAMHPQIDAMKCIGCGACVRACPEDGVLGLIEGKATLVQAAKCVGHGLCAEQCPVGAIHLGMGAPGRSAELPALTTNLETSVPGIFIAGELGGMGLIRNAIRQGTQVIEYISEKHNTCCEDLDVAIVGAGPAGLAAGLAAKKYGLKFAIFEQGDIGGTILQYPRRKIVMTQPVELPLFGKVKLTETRKEVLLELWTEIIQKTDLQINTNEKVNAIEKQSDECFKISTAKGEYRSHHVVLSVGRRGTPRKLGVPGEQSSKVTYRLLEAESYQNCNVLVVGGGDSAVEAAIALASQKGNQVTISYRKGEFTRIKDKNEQRLQECVKSGSLQLLFHSTVNEIREKSVLLCSQDGHIELSNDYVFIFAGGELPYEFLKKIGIQLQSQIV